MSLQEKLKQRNLPGLIELFERNKITDIDIKRNDWDHDKLIRMGIEAEGDRVTVLEIIAGLKQCERQTKIFQDSIHGTIELHPLIVKFIDTPQFQRLRDIKQLGGVYYVYPGASHNRFEHSIGVCHLAGIFIEQLRERQPELGITDREVLCIKIAALCHDMGHGPFSYLFEDLFIRKTNPEWRHEDASVELLKHLVQANNLHDQIEKHGLVWERDCPFISDLITGKTEGFINEKSFLYEIVANSISGVDVGKMDYLLRDCHGLGMKSTLFDWKRYMLCCRVIQAGEDNQYHICPREKEVVSLYEMFHIRNRLFRSAYQHKTKRLVEFMLNEALVKAEPFLLIPRTDNEPVKMSEAIKHMDAFTLLTDSVFYRIKTSDKPELLDSKKLLERVEKRELYTFINRILVKESKPSTPTESEASLNDSNGCSDQSVDGGIRIKDSSASLSMPRLETPGIKTRIAQLSFEWYKGNGPHVTIDDIKEAIKLDLVTFNFDGENKGLNPIEEMYFYKKHSPNKAVPIKSAQTPGTFFPQKFQDFEYRLYCKSKDDSIIEAIRNGSVEFCEEWKHHFEIPPGEELTNLN